MYNVILKLANANSHSQANLEAASDRIGVLEQESKTDPSSNVGGIHDSLPKEVLIARGPTKSTKMPDLTILYGDKEGFFIWKEVTLLKPNANSATS